MRVRKIIKIVATRCQILRLKCTKFDFGWGSALDTLAGFKGSTSKGKGGKEREGERMGGKGMGREEEGGRGKGKGRGIRNPLRIGLVTGPSSSASLKCIDLSDAVTKTSTTLDRVAHIVEKLWTYKRAKNDVYNRGDTNSQLCL